MEKIKKDLRENFLHLVNDYIDTAFTSLGVEFNRIEDEIRYDKVFDILDSVKRNFTREGSRDYDNFKEDVNRMVAEELDNCVAVEDKVNGIEPWRFDVCTLPDVNGEYACSRDSLWRFYS